ncbi:MAG TPA: hypothetical protein VF791_03690 [Pyrinomonadaceae bacterium]
MNKKPLVRSLLLIPAVVMLSVFLYPSGSSAAANENCANPIFAPVLEPLRAKTTVPLRLPHVVGGDYDAVLYTEVEWVGRTRYVVRIGQQCERSYCPYGTVSGAVRSGRESRPRGKAVELVGGIMGYITDGSKSLKDSTITWDQGEYRYTITIYAAEPAALIRVANSALECDKP